MTPLPVPVPSRTEHQKYLEAAVPLISFGFTIAGIFLWQSGTRINFQYYAAGCLISSCILAYLAWIRPRKDIVALSTPLYAFIFFVVPTDYTAGVILQLLYAFSLTILLVRLKYRFGSEAPVPGLVQDGPIEHYAARVHPLLATMNPEVTRNAAVVFIRFAQGDYERAARVARSAAEGMDGDEGTILRAFAIAAEQAVHTKSGGAIRTGFMRFGPEDALLLFNPAGAGLDEEQEYLAALDNALLLLYAAGLASRDEEKKQALTYLRPFALKLSGT
jgi:hypothetical protein